MRRQSLAVVLAAGPLAFACVSPPKRSENEASPAAQFRACVERVSREPTSKWFEGLARELGSRRDLGARWWNAVTSELRWATREAHYPAAKVHLSLALVLGGDHGAWFDCRRGPNPPPQARLEALRLLGEASAEGDQLASLLLGDLLRRGFDDPQAQIVSGVASSGYRARRTEAASLFLHVARQGNKEAMFQYATALEDEASAESWLRKSAEAGHVLALYVFLSGRVHTLSEVDRQQARQWFRQMELEPETGSAPLLADLRGEFPWLLN